MKQKFLNRLLLNFTIKAQNGTMSPSKICTHENLYLYSTIAGLFGSGVAPRWGAAFFARGPDLQNGLCYKQKIWYVDSPP